MSDLLSPEASGLLSLALLRLAGEGGLVVDRVADGGLLRVSPAVQLLREPRGDDLTAVGPLPGLKGNPSGGLQTDLLSAPGGRIPPPRNK